MDFRSPWLQPFINEKTCIAVDASLYRYIYVDDPDKSGYRSGSLSTEILYPKNFFKVL
jgi:hypothetical protein